MSTELHCHCEFSVDGSGSPENLVEAAAAAGVTTLAITEHNHLGSLLRARARSERLGLRYIPGIEFDACWKGACYHFVAFGFDPADAALQELARRQHMTYDRRGRLIVPRLPSHGVVVDEAALEEGLRRRYPSHPEPALNQWFLEAFLLEQGLVRDKPTVHGLCMEIRRAIAAEQGDEVLGGFAELPTVLETVHAAGGVLLIAHVGKYFPDQRDPQLALIEEVLAAGVDGFELYHPVNCAQPHFEDLIAFARGLDCALSGGSDCHHAGTRIGNAIGSCPAPDWVLDRLDQRLTRCF